ncbi:hypothetical protein [Lutibacter sp.]
MNVKGFVTALTKRKVKRKTTTLKCSKEILYKYAKTVSPASEGCVTDKF